VAIFSYFNGTAVPYTFVYVNRRNNEARAHIAHTHTDTQTQLITLPTPRLPLACVIKLEFQDADTDTDTDILARILADTSDARFPEVIPMAS